MPNKRDLNLDGYGISKRRYQELKSFCLQYPEWKDKLKYCTDTVKSKVITDMPICHTGESQTETLAIDRNELSLKCDMVENSLIEAIKTIYKGDWNLIYGQMIKAVTNDDINYAYLDEIMNIDCGRNTYWKIRRYFFFLLSKKRK